MSPSCVWPRCFTGATGGWYEYHNTDFCAHLNKNISIPIKGQLSADPASPGELKENFDLFNHTVGTLDPNYVFHTERDSSGALTSF